MIVSASSRAPDGLISAVLAACLALAFPAPGHAENALSKLQKALNSIAGAARGGNLIVNGSFEDPVVPKGSYVTFQSGQSFGGWQVVGAGSVSPISGDYAQSGIRFNAQHGAQWLDMTGPMSNSVTGVQQAVRTQPGAKYELVFHVGNVAGGMFGTDSSIEVQVDGKSLGISRNANVTPGMQNWGQVRLPITAAGASTTITFINRDPSGDNSNGLDNVSLVPAGGDGAAGTAVLSESFEAPATANYTTFKAGQSFTSGANTWTVSATGVDLCNTQVRREVAAFDGNQAIDLSGSPGAGVLATSFATRPGQMYQVSFQFARNNALGATPGHARVEVLGAVMLMEGDFRHDAAVGPFNTYRPFKGSFVADGATATLRFTSLNPGVAGITIDAVSVTAAEAGTPATAASLSGEYTYLQQGRATVTQTGDDVQIYSTWLPAGQGPHYSFKGKLKGDTITGEWYSFYHGKGWFRWVAKVMPNGDIESSQSDDPINANVRQAILTRQR